MGNNVKLYRQLLGDFRREHADTPERIKQALDAKDTQAARFLAHALRGVAVNLGLGDIGSAAAAIENTLESGHKVKQAQVRDLCRFVGAGVESIGRIAGDDVGGPQVVTSENHGQASAMTASLVRTLQELDDKLAVNDFGAVALLERILAGAGEGSELYQALLPVQVRLRQFDYHEARRFLTDLIQIPGDR